MGRLVPAGSGFVAQAAEEGALEIAGQEDKEEEEAVGTHFNYLKNLLAEGKLVLAGRTVNMPMTDRDMGIAILEADSEEEARTIMENDPAVVNGVMKAELFEFSLALYRH